MFWTGFVAGIATVYILSLMFGITLGIILKRKGEL